jgi:hypothetical protein
MFTRPKIYLEEFGAGARAVQSVHPDLPDGGEAALPFRVRAVCRTGRGPARADVEAGGPLTDLSAVQLRALAAMLDVAADVLLGLRESRELDRRRRESAAHRARQQERALARAWDLLDHGQTLVCSEPGCNQTYRVLPSEVRQRLRETPPCHPDAEYLQLATAADAVKGAD